MKNTNDAINKIHERALRIVLDNNIDGFIKLVAKSQDMTNHRQNIRILMTELFKVVNNLSSRMMHNFITIGGNHYNKFKNIEKNKIQHSIKSNAYNECCTRHKNIEYVFIVWLRVYSKSVS